MNRPVDVGAIQIITPAQVARARADAARSGRRTLDVLGEQLGLEEEQYTAMLAHALLYPTLSMEDLRAMAPAFDVVGFHEATQRECVFLRDADARLLLAFCDPFADGSLMWAEDRLREPFSAYLVQRADMSAFLGSYEESMRAMEHVQPADGENDGPQPGVEDLSIRSINEDTSPVVKLVHSTLYDALKTGVSDIHLETGASALCIKYRIDGVLLTVSTLAGLDLAEQVISRLKVMSELDIAERRVPQDGRFKVSMRGREIDFRVSVMPSIFGEDAVLRILDKKALSDEVKGLRLDYLGFDATAMATMRRLSSEPYGMVLVTGPTGSGKTTTLYAAITEINHGLDKIITIEDPVEYQLPGVLQIPVNEKKVLTFARGLRSILRHDPDKIMVGEIRDAETAQIAIQSALTGHLVFTTVHANSAFDVIGRFIHMGVDPYSFVSALNGVMAQRLVRLSCRDCVREASPDPAELAASGLTADAVREFAFRVAPGCGKCRGSGYRGRKAIAETLVLNDEIRELIIARASIRSIKEAACRNGTRFLRESALDLVRNGETTLQEINRVTLVA